MVLLSARQVPQTVWYTGEENSRLAVDEQEMDKTGEKKEQLKKKSIRAFDDTGVAGA
jgi:hypothetical protein